MDLDLSSLPAWALVGGGLLGGRLLHWGENAVAQVSALLLRGRTSSLTVDEHEGSVCYWLLGWCQHYLPGSTHLLALHRRMEVDFGPAPGLYVIRWRGRRILLERSIYQAGPQQNGQNMTRLKLTIFGKDRAVFKKILTEAEKLYQPGDDRLSITVQADGYWGINYRETTRPLSSVLLPADLKADLVGDVAQFLAGEDEYRRLCISWQRGFLLHGPPGNGKTSLIRALAAHFKLPLYVLNLADPKVTDGNLQTLLGGIGRAIVLLEDIDSVLPGREVAGGDNRALTFSGVLNALDGVVAATGRLVFMTTNHPEQLDPALTRPGRIDRRVLIENPTVEEIAGLWLRFFPHETEWADTIRQNMQGEAVLSMAVVQGALLQYRNDAGAAAYELFRLFFNPPPVILPAPRIYASGNALPAPAIPASPQPTRAAI